MTHPGAAIKSFMLNDAPKLVGFLERMTWINHGGVFHAQSAQLGSSMRVDYVSRSGDLGSSRHKDSAHRV